MNAQHPPAPDDARLVVLEERLMFQQQLIDKLSDAVLEQRRELDGVRREQAQFRGALERLQLGGGEDLPHEKPPHY